MNFKQVLNALLVLTLFAGACSDDPEPTNRCADVECEGGVCDSATGECINPASCEDADDCLSGFVCEDNACVEAVTNDCRLDGCERGECDNGSGECVNAGSCTAGSEEVRCLEGFRCVSAVCTDEASFCEDLNCQRGECSFEELECVDSETCEADSDCLAGNYCDDGTCAANTCDANMVDCARGVCDAATGECVNPESCAAPTECLDDNLCVGGACTPASEACDCPGNQICQYDEGTLSVSCEVNPEGCGNALDCKGADICVDGACVAAEACTADAFEPNDTEAETVAYLENEDGGALRALTVCENDVDRFMFDTREDPEDLGTLRVDVNIAPSAVGQGVVTLTLFGPNGSEVGSAQNLENGEQTARVRIDQPITNLTRGEYVAVVEGSDLSVAGVPYTLTMDLLSSEIINACTAPTLLVEGQSVNSISTSGASVSLTTECGVNTETVAEDVYTLVLEEEGFVNILAAPQPLVDITVGIRQECASDSSELSCVNDEISGGIETLGVFLQPGTYYVVVQGPGAGVGGAYALTYNVEEVVCTPNSSQCLDANTVEVCNPNGTGTAALPCSEGCDNATGRCIRLEGDVCERPFVVNSFPFNTEITWANFANDYEAGAGTCLDQNSANETNDSDAVFQFTLPPGEAIVANLDRGNAYVSMYLGTDCSDLVGSCVQGANDIQFGDEELIYLNETNQDQTYFLVVDHGATPSTATASTLNLSTRQIICVPESKRCVLDRESQTCNELGTAYESSLFCEFGCNQASGECQPPANDSCGGAEILVPNTTIVGEVAFFTDTNRTGTCTGSTSVGAGRDAVYQMSLNESDIVTIDVESDYNVMLWISDGCVANSLNTCLRRVNQESSSVSNEETLRFVAQSAGDYFIVVDTVSSTVDEGTFTLSASVTAATCIPGETNGCNVTNSGIQYCNEFGLFEEYTCDQGCSNGVCNAPRGDICADAIPLTNGSGSVAYGFSGQYREHDVPADGAYGECSLEDAPGFDRMFRVDLQAGEKFTLSNFETNSTSYARIYAVRDCGEVDTCFGFSFFEDSDEEFVYIASQPESFFIVAQYGLTNSTDFYGYTFDWEITATSEICIPNDQRCSDANTVEVCNFDGSAAEYVSCPGACVNGGCLIEESADECVTAQSVGSGFTFKYRPTDFADDFDFSAGVCGGSTFGRDIYFSVNLLADEVLRVNATHEVDTHYPVISVFSDCNDPQATCLGAARGQSGANSPELAYQAKQNETVIVAIDSTASAATSEIKGSVAVTPPECQDGPPVCNGDGDGLTLCQNGVFVDFPCNGTCTNNKCDNPGGDVCFDAIPLNRALTETTPKNFTGTNHLVNREEGWLGACGIGDTFGGIDIFYSVDLLAGERLQAELTGLSSAYLSLLESCDYDSCLAYDEVTRRNIDYVAPQDQTVFLVVDRTTTSTITSTVEIEYSITPNFVCVPGEFQCIDADTAQKCDELGQLTGALYECPWGCDAEVGRCAVEDAAIIDVCATAPAISQNFAAFATHDMPTDHIELSDASCLGTDVQGTDFFHAIDLDPEEYVQVTVDRASINSTLFYLFSDCSAAEATCVGGAETTTSSPTATFTYQAGPVAERIYLGIDTEFTTSDRPLTFEVEFLTPTCTPGVTPIECNGDDTGLVYCDDAGFPQEVACDGACDPATNRCVTPSADSCPDAQVVSASGTVTDSFANFTNVYELPITNACTTSRTPGNDAVYEVSLLSGQTLTASVVSTEASPEDVAIYVTDVCELLPDACIDGSDNSIQGAESVTYTATTDETVYVIVDSYFSGLAGSFEVTFTIQ